MKELRLGSLMTEDNSNLVPTKKNTFLSCLVALKTQQNVENPYWSDVFHPCILNMWLGLDLLMRYSTVWGFSSQFVDDRAPVATKRKTGTLMYCVLCLRQFNRWQLVVNNYCTVYYPYGLNANLIWFFIVQFKVFSFCYWNTERLK